MIVDDQHIRQLIVNTYIEEIYLEIPGNEVKYKQSRLNSVESDNKSTCELQDWATN